MDEPVPSDLPESSIEPDQEFWDLVNDIRAHYAADSDGIVEMPVPVRGVVERSASDAALRRRRFLFIGGCTGVGTSLGAVFGTLVDPATAFAQSPTAQFAAAAVGTAFLGISTLEVFKRLARAKPRTMPMLGPLALAWADYEQAVTTLCDLDVTTESRLAAEGARERLLDIFDTISEATDNFAPWSLSNEWTTHPVRPRVMDLAAEFVDTCAMAKALAVIESRRHLVEEAAVSAPPVAVDSAGRGLSDHHGLFAAATSAIESTRLVAESADLPVPALAPSRAPAAVPTVPAADPEDWFETEDYASGNSCECAPCGAELTTRIGTHHMTEDDEW